MVNYQGAPLEEQVKILLEQNLAYSKEIYHLSKKIRHQLLIGRTASIIGLLVFVVLPIILGVAFLPSLLKGALGNILPLGESGQGGAAQELLQGTGFNQQDIMKMIEEAGGLPNLLKKLNSVGQE